MPDTLADDFLAAMPLPGLLIAPSGQIIAANDEARTLLGAQIVGLHYATILRQPPLPDAIGDALHNATGRDTTYLADDGIRDTRYDVSCRPVAAIGALLVSFQDATQLEQAGQMRRDFVANVSHELRTPLTALIGFIETLQGPARDDDAARARFLSIMAGEAARMNRLVGDLLSLSRVEEDERVRPRQSVDLRACLEATLGPLRPLAARDDVALSLSLPEAEVCVPGDADQLRQVFTNLIENAVKYGGNGGRVTIALTTTERDTGLRAAAAIVTVSDTGPGIAPEHLPRLTERFYRADTHRSREMGGTGLGLAIVKHIVNRHRGRLIIDSAPGQGATFTTVLPL